MTDRINRLETRMDSVEMAIDALKQDWIDTQQLLPTRREVERLDAHLTKQDWILWCLVISVVAGLIVAFIVGH